MTEEAKKPEHHGPARSYKLHIIIPLILLLFSIAYLSYGYAQTGEWFKRSIELKGGTAISIGLGSPDEAASIISALSEKFGPLSAKELRSFSGYGMQIQIPPEADKDALVAELGALGIPAAMLSVETIGPSLGQMFWYQAQVALVAAFAIMGIVVFVIFRTAMPSFYVILCGVSDILATLALMQVFGIELSLAGLAALLMLIGYSIQSDILLTARVLRGEGALSGRIRGAFNTGITMSVTTIAALAALLLAGLAPVLSQIAAVLLIGVSIDIVFTWLENAVILRWWAERKGGYDA